VILVFDLDDTLYPEITYVYSGFRAVASWLHARFGWDQRSTVAYLRRVLDTEGRGLVFNRLLARRGVLTKSLVEDFVRIYRNHDPAITLWPEAAGVLQRWRGPLYLVTDGHKIVQQKKIEALHIEHRFKKMFLTHRYGRSRAKPAIYCFQRIRALEGCRWEDMAYIGDNPEKDFVNLTPRGVRTIRVLTGQHRNVKARAGFEPVLTISSLRKLRQLLRGL